MDFYKIAEFPDSGYIYTPFGGKKDGKWIDGVLSIEYLNENFGQYETATEMKNATESQGLKLFFDWLVEQGKLQK